jgi:hypothetical protein
MHSDTACQALRDGKCLELRYDGFSRVVEVHAVGISTAGNPSMQVWQVRGGSKSNERTGFKSLSLDEAKAAIMLNEKSEAPRTGYKRNAKHFRTIRCQL